MRRGEMWWWRRWRRWRRRRWRRRRWRIRNAGEAFSGIAPA
jgi:hypothetical protein